MAFISLELAMHLVRALCEKEESAYQEDDVTSGDLLTQHREERCGEADDPGDREEQQDAHEHREPETYASGCLALFDGKLAGKNGYEDNVVYAKNDLERSECREGNPRLRVSYPIHSVLSRGQSIVDQRKIPKWPSSHHRIMKT